MGARPSTFKKGGGFLNGVDVTLVDYQWTDDFNGEPFKPGKIKGRDGKPMDKPHSLNFFLTVRVDGADEDTTTTLKAASNFENFEISEDGHVLTMADGSECSLGANSATGKLLSSLITAGFPETALPEDADSIDLTAILGTRVRLVQRKDEERTREFGKRKGKDGKEYDRQDLVVDQVYDLPAAAGKAAKGGSKPTAGVKGKAKSDEDALDELTAETLLAVLEDAPDNEMAKAKLSVPVIKKLGKNPLKEAVRKRMFEDEFLQKEEGWSYSKGVVRKD